MEKIKDKYKIGSDYQKTKEMDDILKRRKAPVINHELRSTAPWGNKSIDTRDSENYLLNEFNGSLAENKKVKDYNKMSSILEKNGIIDKLRHENNKNRCYHDSKINRKRARSDARRWSRTGCL